MPLKIMRYLVDFPWTGHTIFNGLFMATFLVALAKMIFA